MPEAGRPRGSGRTARRARPIRAADYARCPSRPSRPSTGSSRSSRWHRDPWLGGAAPRVAASDRCGRDTCGGPSRDRSRRTRCAMAFVVALARHGREPVLLRGRRLRAVPAVLVPADRDVPARGRSSASRARRERRRARIYAAALAAIGAVIAAYHVLLEWFPSLDSGACDPDNPCTLVWFRVFGFISLPTLALTAFLLILTLWPSGSPTTPIRSNGGPHDPLRPATSRREAARARERAASRRRWLLPADRRRRRWPSPPSRPSVLASGSGGGGGASVRPIRRPDGLGAGRAGDAPVISGTSLPVFATRPTIRRSADHPDRAPSAGRLDRGRRRAQGPPVPRPTGARTARPRCRSSRSGSMRGGLPRRRRVSSRSRPRSIRAARTTRPRRGSTRDGLDAAGHRRPERHGRPTPTACRRSRTGSSSNADGTVAGRLTGRAADRRPRDDHRQPASVANRPRRCPPRIVRPCLRIRVTSLETPAPRPSGRAHHVPPDAGTAPSPVGDRSGRVRTRALRVLEASHPPIVLPAARRRPHATCWSTADRHIQVCPCSYGAEPGLTGRSGVLGPRPGSRPRPRTGSCTRMAAAGSADPLDGPPRVTASPVQGGRGRCRSETSWRRPGPGLRRAAGSRLAAAGPGSRATRRPAAGAPWSVPGRDAHDVEAAVDVDDLAGHRARQVRARGTARVSPDVLDA